MHFDEQPQCVYYVQDMGPRLLVLVGGLCRGTLLGCIHLGRGSCSCWLLHTLVNYWYSLVLGTEEGLDNFPWVGGLGP